MRHNRSCMTVLVTEDEVCSPIDMDKFYTEARRPWASPSSNSIGFKTPIRMYPYNDETPCANARCNFASSEFISRVEESRICGQDILEINGFSHCEFAAARPTGACQLLTETSIDFPTTPKINGRNCADGPEIDATSDLGWLLRAEPPLNSSHGLARTLKKTFSKKGKKLVSYRRSRGQGK